MTGAAGAALGGGVVVLVAALLHRTCRPALEVRRYADDVLDAGLGIARNLEGLDELARTRELVGALRGGPA
jgi:hypothetical protein